MRRRGFLALLAVPTAGCGALPPDGEYGLPPCDGEEHDIRVLNVDLEVRTPSSPDDSPIAVLRGRVRNIGGEPIQTEIIADLKPDSPIRENPAIVGRVRTPEFRVDSGSEREFEATSSLGLFEADDEVDGEEFELELTIANAAGCAQSWPLL